MKALLVTMPDGSEWAVPLEVIAKDRAEHYADEFNGDVQRSLDEDTMPLFESSPYDVADWASGNMNWEDVESVAIEHTPAPPMDFQEGWVKGEKRVAEVEKTAPRVP